MDTIHSMQPHKRSTLHTIFSIIPYIWSTSTAMHLRIALAGICTLLSIGCNLIVPMLFKRVIGAFSCNSVPSLGMLAYILLGLYGIMWTLSQVMVFVRELLMYQVIERAITDMSLKLFDHIHALSMRFHLNRQTGAVTSSLSRIQEGIPDLVWGIFFYIIPTIIEICGAISIVWALYGTRYGATLLVIMMISLYFSVHIMNWSARAQRKANEAEADADSHVVDSLLNAETIKYFDNQELEHAQANKWLSRKENARTKKYVRMSCIGLGQGAILGVGLTLLTFLSGKAVMQGTMQIADFTLINGYILQFLYPLYNLGFFLRQIKRGLTNIDQVNRLLAQQPDIVDTPNAIIFHAEHADIRFEHVSFGYNHQRLILHDVSFYVPSGTTMGIVGTSGAGKSTISRLLFRFYDVIDGKIMINGIDIRDMTQQSLRAMIGIVPQDTVLFNNTLRYNILYGNPSASQEELDHAVSMAHLETYVNSLPQGLNTPVGERGLKLSGGEKQRIAIARMLLKKPIIYIYDEATSALDTQTEYEIQRNLQEISSAYRATTLVIAHRLSTVMYADSIIVLDKSGVAEQGTHEELLQKNGLYAQLWHAQASGQFE